MENYAEEVRFAGMKADSERMNRDVTRTLDVLNALDKLLQGEGFEDAFCGAFVCASGAKAGFHGA